MEEDIKKIQERMKLSRDLFEAIGCHCYFDENTIQIIENLIKGYKELEEKVNKYEKQIDLEWVEKNYIDKSKEREKIEEYENKLKQPGIQNINTAAYSYYLGKKEGWEQLLQEGDTNEKM